MSVSGISSSSFFNFGVQQEAQKEFQQLGQDLQAGNLSAAQADFVTLQKYAPQSASTSSSQQSNNPIAQAFNQLSQDLQSGNLTAAQQDYSTLQSDLQNQGSQVHHHHHHHHHSGGSEQNSAAQAFSQLGQALQSGNLSAAQQAYATLQQDLPQFAQSSSSTTQSGSSQSSSNNVSVVA